MSTLTSFLSPPLQNLPPHQTQIQNPNTNGCISLKSFNSTIKVPILHGHLLKTGSLSNLYNCNTLIHKYCELGYLSQAHQLFNEMSQRNLVSWTSLISGYARLGRSNEALEFFIYMLNSGIWPNEFAFGSVLRACTESQYVRFGAQLHGLIMKAGFTLNEFVDSALIIMYSKNGNFDTANSVLVRMHKKDVFSWTSMIVGYSNGGCFPEALELFVCMVEEDVGPNKYTLTSVLKACASLESLKEGSQVHGYAIKSGLEEDVSIKISLIDLYTKVGDLSSAQLIYERSHNRDVVLCTVMIGGCAQNGKPELAIEVFSQMREKFELIPNEFTFANVISACAGLCARGFGACLHSLVIKTGHAPIIHVEGALIDTYAKGGDMKSACRVFHNMVDKDTISCSSILAGFAHNGHDQEALEFYSTLHQSFAKPDPFALASIIVSCARLADQLRGRQIHAQVIKHGHECDTCIASSLIDMYAKSGTIEDACQVFDNLSQRDRIAWTAMIDGYAQHGQAHKALQSFERMKEEGIKPNEVTYVSILYACSHAGLVEDGVSHFRLMSLENGIEPVLHHYVCVVDLLGRAGMLEEALKFINAMPIEPGPLVWRALMGACRIHRNLELGTYAAKHLLELDPDDDSAYVLLANMYAATGRLSESLGVRKAMKKRGVRKVPGLSWIEVGRSFHVFGARDSVHPQKEAIYKVLDELNSEMKKVGYVPEMEYSNLQDMDEEEVERLVCYHSEKLAIGFGLISAPNGAPIRIFKNLRVCRDCHNAIKVISRIRDREIIVRDCSRFHHCSDGKCSCGDYW